MNNEFKCELCGEPMPEGEEMFKFHGYSGPCPKPPINNPAPLSDWQKMEQQLAELTMQCEKVVKWKYAMSYNDSYFGEPAGDLKRIVYEIERSMPIRGDK